MQASMGKNRDKTGKGNLFAWGGRKHRACTAGRYF